jgi:hypothetical protein
MTRSFPVPTLAAALSVTVFPLATMAGDASPAISFKAEIAPLLRQRCATCHLTGKEAGAMALHPKAARASLVDRQSTESDYLLVRPGAPEESYLIMKLEGTHLAHGGSGARMPFGSPPLKPADIDRIRRWIAEGAADN